MEPKKETLPEIEKIIHSAHLSVSEHRKMANSMINFSDALISLAKSESPEFLEKAKQIAALLHGAMDQENIIANAEERLAEDLNDISVRYDLLYKIGAEIQSKRNQLQSLKKKISELERSIEYSKVSGGASKTLKYQGDLASSKVKKAETAKQLEALLQRLMELKQKYARFKVKRLEHGYKNLGETVAKALEIEKHLLGQLNRDCVQARDNLDDFFVGQLVPTSSGEINQEQKEAEENAETDQNNETVQNAQEHQANEEEDKKDLI